MERDESFQNIFKVKNMQFFFKFYIYHLNLGHSELNFLNEEKHY